MIPITLRAMADADAPVVAALHAASWRSAYRGILSDHYLDHRADVDRNEVWRQRLGAPSESRFGVVAQQGETVVGFVYVVAHADPAWGTLIDNLHVAPQVRSAGIGRRLLAAAASGMAARGWDRRVHLWVFDANARARAFYGRLGGREVETIMKDTPDGVAAKGWRVAWSDIGQLQPAVE
jgi:ribosomal protein S18 acetylase RimI-like enzyme